MTRIRTERLVLETLTRDEVSAILAPDRSGRAWAPDYPSEGDVVVAGIIGEAGDHYDESVPLGVLQVRLAATGDAVGGIGFLSAPLDGRAEVGYGLAESVRGSGLATEALRAVVVLAREEGVSVLTARTDLDNVASQRVLEKIGFARVGREVTEDGVMLDWALDLRV